MRESPVLFIIQPEPPAAQLHLEGAVLFAEKGDHIALLAIEPSKQRRQQHLQRNHTSTLRHSEPAPVFGQYGRVRRRPLHIPLEAARLSGFLASSEVAGNPVALV